jgi:hypothetical protein
MHVKKLALLVLISIATSAAASSPQEKPEEIYCTLKRGGHVSGYRIEIRTFSGYGINTRTEVLINTRTKEETPMKLSSQYGSREVSCD